MDLGSILVPICICVVLPVLIVFLIGRVRQNETNRKTEIVLKAIENGQSIDPELFKSAPQKTSIKKDLLEYLFMGNTYGFNYFLPYAAGAMLAVGIGLFISYYAGKKMLAKEIEAEEKGLLENK